MPLTPGTKLGQYEVLSRLGAGGMGEVYRARDTRLGRDVAIKALPDEFARDPDRLARFEREAKLLASLSHANIAGIFGLEEVDGHRYLILEFVEGETLAHRISRGALSVDESLNIGKQIGAALESAHENGIAHRDLKPGNVMITGSGDVKVLDFGLAKGGMSTMSGSGSGSDLSHSPTMTYQGQHTVAGVILGTAAYMSPEQARGRAVDKRTDIWSFGCVLYECLTGRQAFAGETVSDMIARILEREPDWDALPSRTPPRIVELLHRCLEKDAKRRMRDIGDARIEIENVLSGKTSDVVAPAGGARSGLSGARVWMGAAALVVATAAATYVATTKLKPSVPSLVTRFEIAEKLGTRMDLDGAHVSISPDGRHVAYRAQDSTGVARLWVRSFDKLEAREFPGTDGATSPFWSRDGKCIGFLSQTNISKVPLTGGTPENLAEVKGPRGGTWNQYGDIVYAPFSEGVLYRVSENGGDPVAITTLDSTEIGHRFPMFLPDGKHFLYSSLPPVKGRYRIYMASLDGGERKLVTSSPGSGVVYYDGNLLYARDDVLVAQTFDAKSGEVTGDPVAIGDRILGTYFSGAAGFSVSENGTLAYSSNIAVPTHLQWVDLNGKKIGDVPMESGDYISFDISPDGHKAVVETSKWIGASDLWIVDLERGTVTRLSYDEGENTAPRWSPDGTRVAYQSAPYGDIPALVVVGVGAGSTTKRYVEDDPTFKYLYGWTPDSRALIFGRQDPTTRRDIYVLPLDGDEKPRPYLATTFYEEDGQVSRDGKWMVYDSAESGRLEVYVQSFPEPGAKYQVTTRGGFNRGWSYDGRYLFYGQPSDGTVTWAAEILPGSEFRLGPPRRFSKVSANVFDAALASTQDKMLTLQPVGTLPPQTITIVENWPSLLLQK